LDASESELANCIQDLQALEVRVGRCSCKEIWSEVLELLDIAILLFSERVTGFLCLVSKVGLDLH
jgi:hypothetical protein